MRSPRLTVPRLIGLATDVWPVSPVHGERPGRADRDGAADLWESRRHGTLDDWPWDQAGSYWQPVFRELAETAIESLERDHVHHA